MGEGASGRTGEADTLIPAAKRAWARLITQGYDGDPLVYPRCARPMRIIAFIEQAEVIEKLLTHLGLCVALNWSKGPAPIP